MGKEALKEWIYVGVLCLRVVLFCPLRFHLTIETGDWAPVSTPRFLQVSYVFVRSLSTFYLIT